MRRRTCGRAGVIVAAGLLGVLGVAVPAGASGPSGPTVSAFAASSATLSASGGYVTFSATIVGGSQCTLSSKPGLTGLPSTVGCSSLSSWPSVLVPANTSKKSKTYTFGLSVTPLPGFGTKTIKAAPATVTVSPPSPATFVALGDSYSSGEANPPFTNSTGCDVSQNTSWPLMTAAYLKLSSSDFHDIACSGAEISDLTEPWAAKSQAAQITQLASYTPTVATITIGGNSMIEGATQNTDWGFADILTDCYLQGTVGADPDGCSSDGTLTKADNAITSSAATGLQARLTAAYEAIKAASPSTKLLVVGYPDIFPPKYSASTAFHCGWLGSDDISGLNQIASDLNLTVQAAAAAAGVAFVSTLHVMDEPLCTGAGKNADIEASPSTAEFSPLRRGIRFLPARRRWRRS